nr:MAG: polyprotein [Iflaviridae sp.]
MGMRYAIEPDAQMGAAYSTFKDISKNIVGGAKTIPVIGGLIGGAANAVGNLAVAIQRPFAKPAVISAIEEDLKYIGIINNRDKPINIGEPVEQRPNFTGNLAAGTNVAESILSMRLDPTATCVNLKDHIPEMTYMSVKDFAQIWGITSRFEWNVNATIDTELWSQQAMPGNYANQAPTLYTSQAMVDCLAPFYTYYHGEIEYRFDFICNQFHTGIVTIAYVPYHDTFTASQATSAYWKLVDLREQKSFTFTVPYINNTVVRLTKANSPIDSYGVPIPTPGSIKVFVSNPLNPITAAPTTIDVLVFKRAAPSFAFSYPKRIVGTMPLSGNYGQITYGVPATSVSEVDAQMEDGESENLDQTPDFPMVMPGGNHLQTNEDHMNIKDIMRRWVGIGQHTIPEGGLYAIPVSTWTWRQSGYQRNLQSFLAKQFRYYRGSLRFMFVFQGESQVYVTHTPQGTFSTHGQVGQDNPGGPSSIHFNTYPTQICISRLNPVFKIEIPFHGVYDYLDMQYGFASSNGSGGAVTTYDIVATNLGHIWLTAIGGAAVARVFLAAGDDAEFIKPVPMNFMSQYVSTSTTTAVFLDTNPTTTEEKVENVKQNLLEEEEGVDAQIDDEVDPVMGAYTVASAVTLPVTRVAGFCRSAYNRINNSMASALAPVTNTFSAIGRLPVLEGKMAYVTDKATEYLEYIKEAAHSIVEGIKRSLPWVTGIGSIFSAILHFFQCLINPVWESFCIAISGILVSLGCFAADFGGKIMDFFLSIRPGSSAEDHRTAEAADAQCMHSDCTSCRNDCDPRCRHCAEKQGMFTEEQVGSLVSLMFASIGAWLGWKGEAPSTSIAKGLFNFGKNFWLTIYQSGRFVTSMVSLIKRLFKWIGQKSGFGTAAITLTQENNSVTHFITEATLMLDQRNLIHLETNAAIKYRFWYCVAAAHQMMAKFTGSRLPEAASVLRLAYKIIEKGNDCAVQSMACPVRYEPIVIALAGPSKIGKSFLLQTTLPEILASPAYNIRTHAPPVFVRTPGVEFWNSYQNQPCILYDDFLAVSAPEIAVRQVVELYNLKSSAQFNLNMASLEEKKMLGNPFMVALSCNNPFAVLNGTVCPEAFLRRKEFLWDVKLKSEYSSLSDVPDDVKEKYGMYEFRRYSDPSLSTSLQTRVYEYDEWKALMIEECKKYHLKEQENVKKRLAGLQALLPETARQMMSEVDPFRIFYASYMGAADVPGLTQGGLLPSQLIELQLNELANMPSNGSLVVNVGENVPDPVAEVAADPQNVDQVNFVADVSEDEAADAQLDLNAVTTKAWEWIRYICTAPHPNGPLVRPQLYKRQGDCPVCMSEQINLEYGCENGHAICDDCNHGIRTAANELVDGAEYTCPVCRGRLISLLENSVNAANILRPLVWYYKLKAMGVTTANVMSSQYQRIADYLAAHKWAQRALSTALFVAYLSGTSYLNAKISLSSLRSQEYDMHAWAEADDPCRLTFMKRWGIMFGTACRWIPRREYRERMHIIDPDRFHMYGTDEERAMDVARYQAVYGPDGLTFAQMDSDEEEEGVFATAREYPSLSRPRHPALVRYIPTVPPVHATAASSCRHMAIVREDPDNIFYVADDSGTRMWSVGVYQGETVIDQPCQFEQCVWKDPIARFNFLNRWAHVNGAMIQAIKHQWTVAHGMFKLPLEFISEQALQAADVQRSALVQAVEAFRGKTWWEWGCEKIKQFGNIVKLGAAIAAGIATFLGAFKLFKHFMATPTSEVVPQLVNSGSFNTRRLQRTTVAPRQLIATAHISEDVEGRAVRAIEKNTIFLNCSYEFEGVKTSKELRGFGLFGRTYMIPGHYAKFMATKFAKFKKGEIQNFTLSISRFVNRECRSIIEFNNDTFKFTNNDIAYGTSPPDFPMFKDLSGYIPTLEQHRNIGGTYLHIECEPDRQVIQSVPGTVYGVIDKQKVKGTTNWESYDIFDAYMTSYGKQGSCGSILVADINTPLFAMHVAGHNNNPLNSTGYALPLIREDVEDLKKGVAVLSYWHPILKDPADAHMQLQGAMMPMGGVTKDLVAYMPTKSKIVPSLLQGQLKDENGEIIPTVTQPGILSKRDPRYEYENSPLYYGCLKHTKPPMNFDQEILDFCIDQISGELNPILEPGRDLNHEMTLQECITGFNDREYYDSVDLNTSAGWPWNTGTKKVKSDYINVVRDKHSNVVSCTIDPSLLKVLEQNNAMREEGIRPFTVFLDWLKDERRKEKKLKLKDGTRVFSLSPVDLTIHTRQSTLDFCASFMKYRERTESAVGIVVDGSEWSRLANALLSKSKYIVTGDYTDFGPRLASQVVRAVFKIIARWYKYWGMRDPVRLRKLEVICEETANANHIMHDFVYQTMCGQPSGCSLTVIVNSLANMIYMRYAWMRMFPTSDQREFKEKVFLKVYGDDLIMSVHPSAIAEFNCQTLSKFFRQYDIIFTDASKTGTEEYISLEKATFLKSAFLPHPKFDFEWLSALEKTSIYECAQWVWKSFDHTRASLDNAEQSLRLAYGHGPEFFIWWRKVLNRCLTEMRLAPLSLTWDRIDKQFFTGYEGNFILCDQSNEGQGPERHSPSNDSGLKGGDKEVAIRRKLADFLVGSDCEVLTEQVSEGVTVSSQLSERN